MLTVITHSVIKVMLEKFALKFNKCALNVEIDLFEEKNNLLIRNEKSSQKAGIFFMHHQHFDYKTWK